MNYEKERRKKELIELNQILPFLGKVNNDLYKINSTLRPNPEDNNQYAHWVYEIKSQLDFIASALTDEFGHRFGGICLDGHIFKLLHLYKDSIQLTSKSIQEKMVLELLIKVCTEIIVANGNGEPYSNSRNSEDYALENTRLFINHLVDEHAANNHCREKNVWFDIYEPNYINKQE